MVARAHTNVARVHGLSCNLTRGERGDYDSTTVNLGTSEDSARYVGVVVDRDVASLKDKRNSEHHIGHGNRLEFTNC